MRTTALAFMLLFFGSMLALAEFSAPEFNQPWFDHFTRNFLNPASAGKADTGIAGSGGMAAGLNNPAVMDVDHLDIDCEMLFKSHGNDYNKADGQDYKGTIPFGFAGIAFPVGRSNIGFSFSLPYSLYYDEYSRYTMSGEQVQRFPEMNVYRYTGAFSTGFGAFRVGLAAMLDHYAQVSYRKYYLWDNVEMDDYVFRFQAGAKFTSENFAFGVSFMPEATHDFDMSVLNQTQSVYLEKYDTTLPMVLQGGTQWRMGLYTCYAEVEWQNCSAQSSAYDDRMIMKFGVERDMGEFIVRAGLIDVPSVFEGEIMIPQEFPIHPGDAQLYNPDYDTLIVEDHSQMFLTGGITYRYGFLNWSNAIMLDVKGNTNYYRLSSGVSINVPELGARVKDIRK